MVAGDWRRLPTPPGVLDNKEIRRNCLTHEPSDIMVTITNRSLDYTRMRTPLHGDVEFGDFFFLSFSSFFGVLCNHASLCVMRNIDG